MLRFMQRAADMIVVLVALAFVTHSACSSSPEAKRAEAASSYASQQADCIATRKGREAIDACLASVRAAWRSDAGTEGGAQ